MKDILGVARDAPAPAAKQKAAKKGKPKGMNRELFNLIGDNELVSMVRGPRLLPAAGCRVFQLPRIARVGPARCRRTRFATPLELPSPAAGA